MKLNNLLQLIGGTGRGNGKVSAWHAICSNSMEGVELMNAGLNNMVTIERIARHLLVLCQDMDFAKDLEATLPKEDYQATIVRSPRQAAFTVLNRRDLDAIICDARIWQPVNHLTREFEREML